jgi:RimJ/RimL family protein N-acetyltransferase
MDNPKITIRDFTEDDIVAEDEYFRKASDEFIYNMGVDVSAARNFPPSSRVQPLLAMPVKERPLHCFAVQVEYKFIGLCIIKKIKIGIQAEIHAHIFNLEDRHKGYAQKIFWQMIEKVFETFDAKVLICEPSATNLAPNAFLQKMGLKVIAQVTNPAEGILREHLANRYEITNDIFQAAKAKLETT